MYSMFRRKMDIYYCCNRNIYTFLIAFCVVVFCGCNKLVEVGSPTQNTNQGNVYNNDANAIAVLNGIYATMSSKSLPDGSSINSFMTFYSGLSADEYTLFDGTTNDGFSAYYRNDLISGSTPSLWLPTYSIIFTINSAIEGLSGENSLSANVKKQLLGEAKFLRALHCFYLVNLYGDVPLPVSTDYKVNSILARSPIEDVYNLIIADLKEAEDLLSDDFVGVDAVSTTTERVTPNKWAAKALLARTYLYKKDYTNAIALATEVINNNTLFELVDLNSAFLMNNREAIWQLQPVNLGWNTEDGHLFVIPETGLSDSYPVYLSDLLLNSFEVGDERRKQWVDSVTVDGVVYHYPSKYKSANLDDPITEYENVFRLAEMYLVRSEANANVNDISSAIRDLNVIRNRASLGNYSGMENQTSIIAAILHEKRIEFFSEWGHRWLDLKRTGIVDGVMSGVTANKGGTWNSYDQLYPVPLTEMANDRYLKQNEGY